MRTHNPFGWALIIYVIGVVIYLVATAERSLF